MELAYHNSGITRPSYHTGLAGQPHRTCAWKNMLARTLAGISNPPAKSAGSAGNAVASGCRHPGLQHSVVLCRCPPDALRGKSGNAGVKPGRPICMGLQHWNASFWNATSRVVLICQRPCMRPTLNTARAGLEPAWGLVPPYAL